MLIPSALWDSADVADGDARVKVAVRIKPANMDELEQLRAELGEEWSLSMVLRMLLARGMADWRREHPAPSDPHRPSTDGKGAARRS